jgi:hypothetical protein
MEQDPISKEELNQIKENCLFNANNCGGCETCAQVFSGKPAEYDYRETFMLISMIEERDKRIAELEAQIEDMKYEFSYDE